MDDRTTGGLIFCVRRRPVFRLREKRDPCSGRVYCRTWTYTPAQRTRRVFHKVVYLGIIIIRSEYRLIRRKYDVTRYTGTYTLVKTDGLPHVAKQKINKKSHL